MQNPKKQTYRYGSDNREFVVTRLPRGTVTVAAYDHPPSKDPASIDMDDEGNFWVTYGNEKEMHGTFPDAVDAACEFISAVVDKVAKSRAEVNRFFDTED